MANTEQLDTVTMTWLDEFKNFVKTSFNLPHAADDSLAKDMVTEIVARSQLKLTHYTRTTRFNDVNSSLAGTPDAWANAQEKARLVIQAGGADVKQRIILDVPGPKVADLAPPLDNGAIPDGILYGGAYGNLLQQVITSGVLSAGGYAPDLTTVDGSGYPLVTAAREISTTHKQ